jgi:hypothetical protein
MLNYDKLREEASSRPARQEIPPLLWNTKVNYRVHKNQTWSLSRARWTQSILWLPITLRLILIVIGPTHLLLRLPSELFY